MPTTTDIGTLEERASLARARAREEIEHIINTDARVRPFAIGRKTYTLDDIRECLIDYSCGLKLPHELSWLRFTPASTVENPSRYPNLHRANSLTRAESSASAAVDEFVADLAATGTVVV
jgi:hypothetical protein